MKTLFLTATICLGLFGCSTIWEQASPEELARLEKEAELQSAGCKADELNKQIYCKMYFGNVFAPQSYAFTRTLESGADSFAVDFNLHRRPALLVKYVEDSKGSKFPKIGASTFTKEREYFSFALPRPIFQSCSGKTFPLRAYGKRQFDAISIDCADMKIFISRTNNAIAALRQQQRAL